MSTIPVNTIIRVTPNVLAAGGNAIDLNGLILTTNNEVPIGDVHSFSSPTDVGSYFGLASAEKAAADKYFAGYAGSTKTPGALLFTQYPASAVGAYLRGGSLSAMSLTQLQALSGSMNVVVDGYNRSSGSVTLSAAVSFSAAATTLQSGLNAAPVIQASFTGAIAGGTLTVTGTVTGIVGAAQTVQGTGVAAGTYITGQLSGSAGGTGTYGLSISGSVGTEGMTTIPTPVAVSFDSIQSAFVVRSGAVGAVSSAGYAGGPLGTALFLDLADGAVLSQGAAAAVPGTFMDGVKSINQKWALFTTLFDPDAFGAVTNKLAFSAWANTTLNRFGYVVWDVNVGPTLATPAPTSLMGQVTAASYSGTFPIWEPSDLGHQYFILGIAASFDFGAENGRATFAFRHQDGLLPGVTNETVAGNLLANGYNWYGAYGAANADFQWVYDGGVSGPFLWMDSYVDQIWFNAQLQGALANLVANAGQIPYNDSGYTAVKNSLQSPIAAAGNFGVWRAGVTLSSSQINAVNSAAGGNVAGTLQTQGWYLQVKDPGATVRQARGSPVINLWYTDGQSVQQIRLNSVNVQ